MKEIELAKIIVDWLLDQNWEVYQEVQFSPMSNIADIVAVRHNIMWIIESKTTYGFTVLQQASSWPVHYRSIAIPREIRLHRDYRVAEHYYRVGVLDVRVEYKEVYESVKAPLVYRKNGMVKQYLSKLTKLHKSFAKAGSKGGQHLTPYKITMMEIEKMVKANPGCTVGFLYDQLGEMHYSSAASFKGNLVKCLVDFEKDWCRVDMKTKPYKLFIRTQQ